METEGCIMINAFLLGWVFILIIMIINKNSELSKYRTKEEEQSNKESLEKESDKEISKELKDLVNSTFGDEIQYLSYIKYNPNEKYDLEKVYRKMIYKAPLSFALINDIIRYYCCEYIKNNCDFYFLIIFPDSLFNNDEGFDKYHLTNLQNSIKLPVNIKNELAHELLDNLFNI